MGGTSKNAIISNGLKIYYELSNMHSKLTIRYPESFVEKNDHNLTVGRLND